MKNERNKARNYNQEKQLFFVAANCFNNMFNYICTGDISIFYLQKSYICLSTLLFSTPTLVTIIFSLLFFSKIGNNKDNGIFKSRMRLKNYNRIIKFIIMTNIFIQTFSFNK